MTFKIDKAIDLKLSQDSKMLKYSQLLGPAMMNFPVKNNAPPFKRPDRLYRPFHPGKRLSAGPAPTKTIRSQEVNKLIDRILENPIIQHKYPGNISGVFFYDS